ncbi:MAG: 2-C-methyl-D-erythritol 2,4-cyclodiphosphate synthase [bacterium]|nr:2-C-methyl-D-erythritol 2,4-cyclodiphosphate synthase [bacterium]
MRIGYGTDTHKLVESRDLILGGVKIDFEKGLLGHSDADVLLHAIMDALLGAMGLGDIGMHFPDTDNQYKDISSVELLKRTFEICKKAGLKNVINLDFTIICQKPKLIGCFPEMKKNISAVLGSPVERINLKASTTEGLGFEGRGEGITVNGVILVE